MVALARQPHRLERHAAGKRRRTDLAPCSRSGGNLTSATPTPRAHSKLTLNSAPEQLRYQDGVRTPV
eukprot:scaffold112001_cov15-Tisochrysis_lutea.AAC.1